MMKSGVVAAIIRAAAKVSFLISYFILFFFLGISVTYGHVDLARFSSFLDCQIPTLCHYKCAKVLHFLLLTKVCRLNWFFVNTLCQSFCVVMTYVQEYEIA